MKASTSATLTLRLPADTKRKLDKLARATGRTKSLLTHLAIDAYVAIEAWQVEAIHEGVRAADAGKFVEHDALKLKWEKKRARALDRKR